MAVENLSIDDIENMLSDCESASTASNHPFSSMDLEFIESFRDQFDERRSLSPKQEAVLQRIWDKI